MVIQVNATVRISVNVEAIIVLVWVPVESWARPGVMKSGRVVVACIFMMMDWFWTEEIWMADLMWWSGDTGRVI